MIDVKISAVILKHGKGDFELWHGFSLAPEDEARIQKILSRYETEGCSVRGSKTDISKEIQNEFE